MVPSIRFEQTADSQGHACLNFFVSRSAMRHRMHRSFFYYHPMKVFVSNEASRRRLRCFLYLPLSLSLSMSVSSTFSGIVYTLHIHRNGSSAGHFRNGRVKSWSVVFNYISTFGSFAVLRKNSFSIVDSFVLAADRIQSVTVR